MQNFISVRSVRSVTTAVLTVLLAFGLFASVPAPAFASACTFTSNVSSSGNWSASASWSKVGTSCGTYPGSNFSGDTVVISSGDSINLDVSPANSIASISFGTGSSDGNLTFSGSQTLNVSGTVTLPRAGGTGTTNQNTLNVGSGTLNAAGIAFTGSGTSNRHQLLLSTGTVAVSGSITSDGTSGDTSPTVTISSTGTLKIGSAIWDSNHGSLTTASASTVEYNGSGAQTVGDFDYGNLKFSTSGAKTVPSGVTVAGTLTVASGVTGTLSNGSNTTAHALTLGTLGTVNGTWGSNGSSAANKTNTFFTAANTGIITVATDTRGSQATLTVTGPSSVTYGSTGTLTSTGGTGTGATSYSSTGTGCSISGGTTLNVTNASGTCSVTATKAADGNYSTTTSAAFSVTLNKKTVTPTVTLNNKVYDGTTAATTVATRSLTGIVGADDVTLGTSGTVAAFTSKNVGSYTPTVSGLSLSGTTAGNYVLSTTSVSPSASITVKSITVTADAKTKVFGAADPALTYTGTALFSGDTYSGSLTRIAGENVGTYAIQQGTVSAGTNYSITYTGANLSITKATSSTVISCAPGSFVYTGSVQTPCTATVTGAGSLNTNATVTYGNNTNVGTATADATYAGDSNHTGSTATQVTFAITKATVNVTAEAKSKVYGAADPILTYTAGSLAAGNSFSGSLTRVAGENVGDYAIQQGTLSAGSNYDINYTGANLTIGAKDVNVTADAGQGKTYGAADPALTYSADPLVGSDSYTGSLHRASGEAVGPYAIDQGTLTAGSNYAIHFTGDNFAISKKTASVTPDAGSKVYGDTEPALSGTLSGFLPADNVTATYSRVAGENAGPYTISATLDPVGVLGNYDITYNTATFTIEAKSASVKADDKSKTYGEANPTLTATVLGTVNGDELDYTLSTSADETSAAGDYPITVSLGSNPNYLVTPTDGNLHVDAKDLTITADDQEITYGDVDPAFSFQYSGLVNGDTETDVAPTCSVAGAHDSVGTYPITCSGASDSDYSISYAAGTLTVDAAPLTVTAENKTKVYGADDPALTYTVSGLANGDNESVVTGDLARDAGEDIGDYAINQGTVGASGNYDLTFVPGTLSITKKTINVTATDKSKAYGDIDPALTYTSDPLVDGDSFTGNVARETGEDVGTYEIGQGDLALSSNYSINFTPGTFTIDKVTLTVTADHQTKVFGADDPALTYQVSGLKNGDTAEDVLSGALTRVAGEDVANYDIFNGTLVANGNYTLSVTGNVLSITRATATIDIEGYSGIYDGSAHGAHLLSATGVAGANLSANVNLGDSFTDAPGGTAHWSFANPNYTSQEGDVEIAINKAGTEVSWGNPSDITYGTALSGIQLNATADQPGNFAYTPASGAVLDAGANQTLHVDFTPTDTTNYNGSSKDVHINVNAAGSTVTVTCPNPTETYTGSPIAPCSAGYTTEDGGSGTLTVDYTANTNVGTVTASASYDGDANHTGSSDDATFDITPASLGFDIDPLSQVYDGSPKPVNVTTTPNGVSVTVTYDSSATAPTAVGDYAVHVESADSNYSGSANTTLHITPAGQAITVDTPAPSAAVYNGQFDVEAHADTGNAVAITASGICEVLTGGTNTATIRMTSGTGTCTVHYNAAADANHNTAPEVTEDVSANKAFQDITFTNPGAHNFGDADFGLSATGGFSGNPVTFTSDTTSICTVSGSTLHIVAVGTCSVTANQAGNDDFQDATPNQQSFGITDDTAPVITLSGANPQVIEKGSAYSELGATASDDVDGDISGSIAIDASAVDTATVGDYSVTYNVEDSAHNAADTVTRTVQVRDTTAPPAPVIDTHPTNPSNSQSLSFTFHDTEAGVTLLCAVDADSFADCSAGSFSGTTNDGDHTFHVKAKDASDNESDEETFSWTVDTQAPDVSITSGPQDPTATNDNTPSFGFSSTDATATFKCHIDSGSEAACTSPFAVSPALIDGPHTFTVTATDAAGNTGSDSRTFTVDTQGPVISLNGNNPDSVEVGSGPYSDAGATTDDGSTVNVTGSVDTTTVGDYELHYNATDGQGNAATEVIRVVHVTDHPAPVLSDPSATSPTDTTITVTWDTDHPSTSRVVYGTSPVAVIGSAPNYGYPNSTVEDSTLVTHHVVVVSGLNNGTTYYFRGVSHGSPEAVSDEVSNTTTTPAPTSVTVTIVKYVDGSPATAENTNSASFPMHAVFPGGEGDYALSTSGFNNPNPYQATTADMPSGSNYSTYENEPTTCTGTNAWKLDGYKVGDTMEAALASATIGSASFENLQTSKVIVVENSSCEVNAPTSIKVHIYKYLDGTLATSESANGYQFPMTATWKTANLNGGVSTSGDYVLGNNHGGNADQYGADTSPMNVPADYTTHEITDGASQVLPIGATCEEGKYRLIGYSEGDTLQAALGATKTNDAPVYTGLTSDKYEIVWNEKCGSTPPPASATVVATKIVCDAETDLPNAQGASHVTDANTAAAYVAAHPSCHLESGWQFEWGNENAGDPGRDFTGPAGNGYTTSALTDANGTVSMNVPLANLARIDIREVLKPGYIPFTYDQSHQSNDDTVSAELSCASDGLNYDNWEWINGPQAGSTYYCVAWNVAKELSCPEGTHQDGNECVPNEPPPVVNSCPAPSALDDSSAQTIGASPSGEQTVQQILDGDGYSLNANTDQKEFQVWNVTANTEVHISADYVAKFAGHNQTFGYYVNGDISTFVPVFKTNASLPESVPLYSAGPFSITVPTGATTMGFAIRTYDGTTLAGTRATENSLNGGADEVLVYNPVGNGYVLAFEDLLSGDNDYNDLVVRVDLSCAQVCTPTPSQDVYVSDTTTTDNSQPSVLLSFIHSAWTASIADAHWIWNVEPLADPAGTTIETFTKTFTVNGTPTGATLAIAADNSYSVQVNGHDVCADSGEFNYTSDGQDSCVIPAEDLVTGDNTITFTVTNMAQDGGTQETNPAGLLYKLTVDKTTCDEVPPPTCGNDEHLVGDQCVPNDDGGGQCGLNQHLVGNTCVATPQCDVHEHLNEDQDACIADDQPTCDAGFHAEDYECVADAPASAADICPNLEGTQTDVPSGYRMGDNGLCVKNHSRGGGGGGGGNAKTTGQVLGASTCSPLLTDYLHLGWNNNADQVKALQGFLNTQLGLTLDLSGIFDQSTFDAVKAFQKAHGSDVLHPWIGLPGSGITGDDTPTGFVYQTTRWMINNIWCPGSEAFPSALN